MSSSITEFTLEQVLATADLATIGKMRKIKNRRVQAIMDAKLKTRGYHFERVQVQGDILYPLTQCKQDDGFTQMKELKLVGTDVCDILQCNTLQLCTTPAEVLEGSIVPAAKSLCENVKELIIEDSSADFWSIECYGKIMKNCSKMETIEIMGDDEDIPAELISNLPKKTEMPTKGQKILITMEPVICLSIDSMDQLVEKAGAWPIEIRMWIDFGFTEIEETMDAIIHLFKNAKTAVAVRFSSAEACRWKERFEDRILVNFSAAQKLLAPPEGAESWFGGDAEKRIIFKVGDIDHYMSYYCPRPPFDYNLMVQPDYL